MKVLPELRKLRAEIWLVGGPIRDALLGRPCDDWDMVCKGAKKNAQMAAKKLKAKFITLDEQHKIYRVIVPSPQPRQTSGESPGGLATSPIGRGRSEAAGEGKLTLDFAEIQGRTIQEDLGRRDFTINAMALPLSHRERGVASATWVRQIIDPFEGQRDLKNHLLRVVSVKALTEDPLRLVRAFRFAAQFDLTIEPRTLKAIQKHRRGISRVAAERIREELLRLWKQPHSSKALRLMDRTHLLSNLFPEIEACRRTAVRYYGTGGVLKHQLQTVENLEWILDPPKGQLQAYLSGSIGGYPRSAWMKLGAFLHDVGKPATAKMLKGRLRFFGHEHKGAALAIEAAQRLRCSRQEVHLLGMWVRNHMRTGNLAAAARITDKALSRFFRDLGEDGVGMVLISLADHYTYLPKSQWGKGKDPVEKISWKLVDSYYRERSKILPERLVNGHDLMRALRIKPGPQIGKLLADIQDAQAEGKVTTRGEALAFAKRSLRRHPRMS